MLTPAVVGLVLKLRQGKYGRFRNQPPAKNVKHLFGEILDAQKIPSSDTSINQAIRSLE